AGGLLAVAVLPLLAGLTGSAALGATELAAGFRTAMLISGVTCAAGGLVAALTIRNPSHGPAPVHRRDERCWSCPVSGPPLQPALAAAGDHPD
ncbi:MAG: MFS transporter, partial [Acidimicrobiales bacterium]